MKSLSQYIKENLMSIDEMTKDYNVISDYPDTKTKKDIASKYGIVSKKSADIQKAILVAMRNERNNRREYGVEDITWFRRLSDIPSRYKTLCTWLDEESLEFVNFMRNYYEEKLKSKKSKFGSLFDLKNSAKGRDWNYVMTYADKYLIDTYNNLTQYIEEHDAFKISSKQEQQVIINSIKQKLIENTKEFHDEYIKRVENFANKYWDELPSKIESSKKSYEEAKQLYKEEQDYAKSKILKIKMEEASRVYNSYLMISRKYSSKKEYIDKCKEDAEAKFDANMTTISERLKKQDFIITDIKVIDVHNDPKFYAMCVTDGIKKVYCRSIWAAEFSDKMIPHFRFIITNKK